MFCYWLDILKHIEKYNFTEVYCHESAIYNRNNEYIETIIPKIIKVMQKQNRQFYIITKEYDNQHSTALYINLKGKNSIEYQNNWQKYWRNIEIIREHKEFFVIQNIESYGNELHELYINPSYRNIEDLLNIKDTELKHSEMLKLMNLIGNLNVSHCLFNYTTKSSVKNSFHLQVYDNSTGNFGIRPQYTHEYVFFKKIGSYRVFKHKLEYKIELNVKWHEFFHNLHDHIEEFIDLLTYFYKNEPKRGGVFFLFKHFDTNGNLQNLKDVTFYIIGQEPYNIIQ